MKADTLLITAGGGGKGVLGDGEVMVHWFTPTHTLPGGKNMDCPFPCPPEEKKKRNNKKYGVNAGN